MANHIVRRVWRAVFRAAPQLPRSSLILVVKIYQLTLSPFIGQNCRYLPTCSHYAVEALEHHGAIKGSWMTLKRLARCHPIKWLGGSQGFDPVPGTIGQRAEARDV